MFKRLKNCYNTEDFRLLAKQDYLGRSFTILTVLLMTKSPIDATLKPSMIAISFLMY